MVQKFRNRLYTSAEQGFTLAEMVVVVLILGVLAAISVPVYLGIQNQANVATVKTGLLQASSLIEQEKTDLNGVYPRYLPNEVTQNELWSKFSYTYSNDRLAYCLQGYDNNDTQWFVSSTTKEPSQDICTLPNVGSNSTLPWAPNTPPVISIDSLTMTWPDAASTPTATMSWAAAQCTNRDKNNVPSTKYNVKLIDTSENVTITLKNIDGTNLSTDKLPGFLPSDTVQAYIQVVCITQPTSNSQIYTTTGAFGDNAATAVTPRLPVPDTSYSTDPKATLSQNTSTKAFTMTAAGTINAVTCPLGVNAYQITAAQSGTGSVSSVGDATRAKNWTLSNFAPDTKINYTGYAFCVITRGPSANTGLPTSYPSKALTTSEFSPVGWPEGVTNLATTSAFAGTGTTPNGLTWTNSICTFGGSPYYSYQQDYPNAASTPSSYQPNSNGSNTSSAGPISWLQAKSYTYHINAKCVGQNPVESRATASNALKFTTDVGVATPTYATAPNTYFPAASQLNVRGQFNPITCVGDSVAYYSLAATNGYGSYASSNPSTSTSFDFALRDQNGNNFAADTNTTYYGYAYCYVTQYDGAPQAIKVYTSAPNVNSAYTPINAPAATGVYTDNSGNQNPGDVLPNRMVANTTSCPYGGTLYYRFYMTSPSNGTSNWSTDRTLSGSFSNGYDMSRLNNGELYRVGAQTYCGGSNVNSGISTGGTIDFRGYYNQPNQPAAPGSIYVTTADPNQTQYVVWSAVGCNRGGTAQYRMVQNVRNGQNIGDSYMNTGWTTATSWNTSGWIDYQGANYQYAVRSRCVNDNFTSAENGWTFTNQFTEGIRQPDAPQNVTNNNFYSVNWNGVYCPSGTYASYLVNQDFTNGSQYNNYRENRTTNTGTGNIAGGTGGFQRVFVYAYCDSSTIGGVSSAQSGGNGTQWNTYGAPSISQDSMGGCNWDDAFYYGECQTSYNSGYPGINGSGISTNIGGLTYRTDGRIVGTPSYAGTNPIYGYLSNPAGSSGWVYLGTKEIWSYNMNARGRSASDYWRNFGGSPYNPCTLQYAANANGGCAASSWNSNQYNVLKWVTSGNSTSYVGIDLNGLYNGDRYRATCSYGLSYGGDTTKPGVNYIQMYVDNGPGGVVWNQPYSRQWATFNYDWTYTGNQRRLVISVQNAASTERELDIGSCYVRHI